MTQREWEVQDMSGNLEERISFKEAEDYGFRISIQMADYEKQKKLMTKGGRCDSSESPRLGMGFSTDTC